MTRQSAAGATAAEYRVASWLFQNSGDLMFRTCAEGRLEDVNPAWPAITGWKRDELLGRRLHELAHPNDLAAIEAMLRGEPAPDSWALRLLTKDGAWRFCEAQAVTHASGVTGLLRPTVSKDLAAAELFAGNPAMDMVWEAACIGFWSFDVDARKLVLSDLLLRKTGYQPAELTTLEAASEVIHPEDRAPVMAMLADAVENGLTRSFQIRALTRDGACMTWRASVEPQPRPDGRFNLVGIAQDVTGLVEARDMALRGEQQSRQIVEGAPFAVAMFDRDLRYMVVSPRWRHAFGLTDREHVGSRLDDVFPGIPKRFVEAQKRALAGEVVSQSEDRFTDSRDQEHRIRWEARPWRGTDGKIGGVLAYVDDISAVVESREIAETNARRLRIALEAADAGVYQIDYAKKTFWASPEFVRLVGATCLDYDDAVHLRYPQFHPDDHEQVRETFREIKHGERRSGEAFETRIVRPDGEERWVQVHHHIKFDRRGRPLQGSGLVLDFDARKRQELALMEAQQSAEAAADAKAAFLANMSHEIRTPMNGVMGVLHLLKNEELSRDGRNMLDEALSCGQMLAELLNDVIDFSKIEAGHLQMSAEPLDPRAVVDGVVRLLGPQAEAKGLRIIAEVDGDLGWVQSDPVRLRQALFNLVGNAVKFTLQGSVVIRCRVRDAAAKPLMRFEIEDTGVGVPAEAQSRIFQRFNQGDASTTRRFGGSGLGLAITQRLAEMMGGSVGFSSVEGRGSVFWLEIAAEPAEVPELITETADAFLDGLRVLVVEDNPTNRMIATKLLENLGAMVETAADGLLGVEAAARNAFDVILMDVQMPGIDGLEASRRIRALPGPAAATPIVALTANVLSHQRASYLEAGMNGVVGKPISPPVLLAEIGRLAAPIQRVAASAA